MSNRLEEELDEILKRVEDVPAAGKPRKTPNGEKSGSGAFAVGVRRVLSPKPLFITSIAMFLSALLLQNALPGLVGVFFWVGFVLIIVAYAVYVARPRSPSKLRWRGKPVDYGPQYTRSLWTRVRGWLKG
jgi:hypothetical protein